MEENSSKLNVIANGFCGILASTIVIANITKNSEEFIEDKNICRAVINISTVLGITILGGAFTNSITGPYALGYGLLLFSVIGDSLTRKK